MLVHVILFMAWEAAGLGLTLVFQRGKHSLRLGWAKIRQ